MRSSVCLRVATCSWAGARVGRWGRATCQKLRRRRKTGSWFPPGPPALCVHCVADARLEKDKEINLAQPERSIPRMAGNFKGHILESVPLLALQSVGLIDAAWISTSTSVGLSMPPGDCGRSQYTTSRFDTGPYADRTAASIFTGIPGKHTCCGTTGTPFDGAVQPFKNSNGSPSVIPKYWF